MIDSLQFLPANLPVYLYNKAQVKFKLERVLVEDLLGRFDDYRRHRALDPPPRSKGNPTGYRLFVSWIRGPGQVYGGTRLGRPP